MGTNATAASMAAVIQKPKSRLLHWARSLSPTWATFVGVMVLVLNLALVPYVARTWQATGDEPHYLLAAHSLVTDLDLDLANNYAQFDYLSFYVSKEIVRQVRYNAAGQEILSHYPAYPILIAPAYALGGRLGVLLFQAILAGLLAAVAFKLAWQVSLDLRASLLATLLVVISPPLLMYNYLVYPELIAAILVTAVLYHVLTARADRPALSLVVIVALALLPWLNRRFIPLAIALVPLVIWSWRRRSSWRGLITPMALTSITVTVLSIALIFWFNSLLSAPVRADITAPSDSTALWSRLVRGSVGWLVDQQRGLLIFAPVYLLAIWGVPILVSDSLRGRNRNWIITLPFLVTLGVVSVAGGFWIAWELGPRFLIVALPALTPLLALAWRNYGRNILWNAAVILLIAVSVGNTLAILRNPELPYKSSLALLYGKMLGLPASEVLPDLADYIRLSPDEFSDAVTPWTLPNGETAWQAPAGESQGLVRTEPLYDLPFGHYILTWPLRSEAGLAADTEVARISIKHLGGGQVFNRRITAADLSPNGGFTTIRSAFTNTSVDRWRTPMILHAVTSGRAELWTKDLWLSPNPYFALVLPYLYLGLLIIAATVTWFISQRTRSAETASGTGARVASSVRTRTEGGPVFEQVQARSIAPAGYGFLLWGCLVLILIAAMAYVFWAVTRSSRVYEASDLSHFVGQPIVDEKARGRQAWLVDPAVDPPQKAVYGPLEIFDPGSYSAGFRLKLPTPVHSEQEIARLQVNATDNFDPLAVRVLHAGDFSRAATYHDLVVVFDNPRRQALSFEVDYLGVAALVIDEVTITRLTP